MPNRDYHKTEIGDAFGYPTSDHGFHNVIPVSDEFAHGLLELAKVKLPHDMWMNKIAYAIAIDDWHGILAIYKHDFKFWLIRRPYR